MGLPGLAAAAFTVYVIVKWSMYHGHSHDGDIGTDVPSAAGVLVLAPLSVWLLVGNASRFWRPTTRAQLAAAEVSTVVSTPLHLCALWTRRSRIFSLLFGAVSRVVDVAATSAVLPVWSPHILLTHRRFRLVSSRALLFVSTACSRRAQ